MSKKSLVQYLPVIDEELIGNILSVWKEKYPESGVLALISEAQKERVTDIQHIFKNKAMPLLGAIFPELIYEEKFCKEGIWLLCFPELPFYILEENLPQEEKEAERICDEITTQIREHLNHDLEVTLYMIFDVMVPNISAILEKLYFSLANRVHYGGGNAGSETFQPMPCLFDSTRLVGNGVLLILLKKHCGAIVEHGYRAPEQTVYATSTTGNRINQINWMHAYDVYKDLVFSKYGVEITPENFYQYSVHFPFGIVRANHHVVVRIPVTLSEDGSLHCAGEVPSNSVLTLLDAPDVNSDETVGALTKSLNSLNGGAKGRDMFMLYCAGRRLHMGLPAAEAELRKLADSSGVKLIAGALSLGEIGGSTTRGYPLFHNAALVASYWYKSES